MLIFKAIIRDYLEIMTFFTKLPVSNIVKN